MFTLTSTISVALLALSSVSAYAVPRTGPPPGWAFGYLEDYNGYHSRYLALNCHKQHGKPFFDECCHPLLATETLEANRPKQCIPSASASSSASAVEATSTDVPPTTPEDDGCDCAEDEECVDDDEPSSAPPAATPTQQSEPDPVPVPAPTTAVAPDTDAPPTTIVPQADQPPPASAPTPAAPPATEAPPANSQVNTGGIATFYFQNGNAGACGDVHSDNDPIAAIDVRRWGDLGQKSDLCGKRVNITNTDNGKSVTVVIADVCPTCNNENCIDLSTGAFNSIGSPEQGTVPIAWSFM